MSYLSKNVYNLPLYYVYVFWTGLAMGMYSGLPSGPDTSY